MAIKYSIVVLVIFCLAGCDGSSTASIPEQSEGIFIDSPVEGLTYSTPSFNGVTDDEGVFLFSPGETVTFSLGDIVLGAAVGSAQLSPLDLAETDDELDPYVVNIVRFLQTLDEDQDPENGIEISENVSEQAAGLSLNFTLPVEEFELVSEPVVAELTSVSEQGARRLVSELRALNHLRYSLGIDATPEPPLDSNNFYEGGEEISIEAFISKASRGTYIVDETVYQRTVLPTRTSSLVSRDTPGFEQRDLTLEKAFMSRDRFATAITGMEVGEFFLENCNNFAPPIISLDEYLESGEHNGINIYDYGDDRFRVDLIDDEITIQRVFYRVANTPSLNFGQFSFVSNSYGELVADNELCWSFGTAASSRLFLEDDVPELVREFEQEGETFSFAYSFPGLEGDVLGYFSFVGVNSAESLQPGLYLVGDSVNNLDIAVSAAFVSYQFGVEVYDINDQFESPRSLQATEGFLMIDSIEEFFIAGSYEFTLVNDEQVRGTFSVALP